jgi:hypothetical protein
MQIRATRMTSFWCISALAFGILITFQALASGQEMPRMSRAQFYATSSFGALAWIPSVTTTSREDARAKEFVRDMSRDNCFSIPPRDYYWFLLNHRDPEYAGLAAFFVVRNLGSSLKSNSAWLSVNRNENWISYDGTPLPTAELESSPQLKLSIAQFIDVHDDSKNANISDTDRRAIIDHAINGVWHALPDKGRPGTWDYRQVFGSRSHVDMQHIDQFQLSARLMHFGITDKNSTSLPVVFLVYRNQSDAIWITVAGPSLPTEIETEIRIGSSCSPKQ